ncbi:LacI family DNA-binding transcriptional regulator [Pseudoalteromonas denitrificans]|uniref:Transcriptional regulator, LacI family n=1 Tax=Pseudoalteromonas denitrificans DSM 6059 TaxID=1123010 RepID=A0A1I1UIC0_9GAMM|nr:LacI family DNA-binding transcriptional regulator [Pseudoalteromonas denitrificans]SFD68503.1 transcriptional regulator, LacI family [Pseudoalteromonas denitrificans DSM 6059]
MSKATINSVAKYAGVSKKTVSRVLNEEPNVSSATREKVQQAFKDLDYRPNPIARGLAHNRSFIIGCLYDNPSKSYITRVQTGALSACHDKSYNLLIHPCELRGQALLDNIDALIRRTRLDGLVLTPPFSDQPDLLAFLKNKSIPYARVAPGELEDDSISIRSNDEQAAFEITELLISLGHTDIAFIKGHPDHSSTTLRFSGYLKALEKNNIEFKPELVDEGNFSYHSGEDSARKILNLKVRPSAVFASNDYMAAAVLKVASQLTLKVPEQLSIAGFDNAPIARHIWPGLTTIAQPVEKMTYIAINKLIEQFTSQEEALPIHKETLEAQLINRESTGRFSE